MAIQIQGNGGTVQDVGGSTFRAGHVHIKPLEYGALGHYRFSVRIASTAAQVANSPILTLRNTHATNLIIPTRLVLRVLQTAAGTAQENSLDVYKATSFTSDYTTNTVTPVSSRMRTSMAAFPGGAAVRHLTLAGNVNGMQTATITKDTQAFATLPYNVAAAINTTTIWGPIDCLADINSTHPFVFAQNEGLVIESRVLNVTSFGVTWYIDISWAEVTAY